MISRVVAVLWLALVLGACSNSGSKPDGANPENPDDPIIDPNEAGGFKGQLCSPSKASVGVEECLATHEAGERAELSRRISTWGSLESNEFVDVLLDRKAFRGRFHLSDQEVLCLKSKICMER